MFLPPREPFIVKFGRFVGSVIATLVAVFVVIILFVLMCKILQFIV